MEPAAQSDTEPEAWADPTLTQPVRRWWLRWLPALPPVYSCEICKGTDVRRNGDWDYCAVGHTYVGARTEHQP